MRDLKAMQPMDAPSRWMRLRVMLLACVFFALLLGAFARAVNLQVHQKDRLKAFAEDQYVRTMDVPARRGEIVDRRGVTLASSVAGVKGPQPGLTGLDAFVAWLRAMHSVLLPGVVLVLVLATVYCTVAAFLWNGRTLGRLLLGLRLVDTHGMAPTPGRAIFRALLAGLSFVLFLGGFWMALFDRRGQTLHDKLTSTFVVQPS